MATIAWKVFMCTVLLQLVCSGNILLDGDVIVAGLFDVYKPSTNGVCSSKVDIGSVIHVEAVRWYFNQLNIHAGLAFKLGLEGFVTCRNDKTTAAIGVQLMGRSLEEKGNRTKPLIGIVGPEYSSEAKILSSILSSVAQEDHILQVGFSTTTVELSDKTTYPNFFRVVPNDDIQIEVMIEVMVALKWNRIALIYENDVYGQAMVSGLRGKADAVGICISHTESIDVKGGLDFSQLSKLTDVIIQKLISGVVFIGSPLTANKILSAFEQTEYSDVPIILFSEGVNMELNAFMASGSVIEKAKGSLAVMPPYHVITEFENHWKSIFTNNSIYEEERLSNPWLTDVYEEVQDPLTEETYENKFPKQPLYVAYAIMAAHVIAKAMGSQFIQHCANGTVLCQTFIEEFQPGDMVGATHNLVVNYASDFEWSPDSLKNRSQILLDVNGDATVDAGETQYEFYNFRESANDRFDLIKVGDYITQNLTINFNQIRDYTNNGDERIWPNVRQVQCHVEKVCDECIHMAELQEGYIFEEGDVYVIGTNPMFEKSGLRGCGQIVTVNTYQCVEAIRLAVHKVNSNINEFAGMKVGVIVLSSCNNPAIIQRKIYNLFENGLVLQNGSTLIVNDKVLGFVGDVGSSISISIAETLTRLQHVQISYASTSPILSDRETYKYFMRVVTPDDAQAKAMINLIKELGGSYIQLLYSEGAYGEGAMAKLLEASHEHLVCIKQSIPINEEGNHRLIYEQLRKFPHARIVVLFLRSHVLEALMKELTTQVEAGEFMFIGSEAWAKNKNVLENDERNILFGSFTLALEEIHQDAELKSHIVQLQPKPFVENPWSLLYLQEEYNCYFPMSFDKMKDMQCSKEHYPIHDLEFVLDTWASSAYVATHSLLLGAHNFLEMKCGASAAVLCEDFTTDIAGLVESIKGVQFDLEGTGSKDRVFNTNGDGNVGYRIYNIQRDPDNPQKLIYSPVGRSPLEGAFKFETAQAQLPSTSFTSVCPNSQACLGCSKQNVSSPVTTPMPAANESNNIPVFVMAAISGVFGIATIILVVIVTLQCRRKPEYNGKCGHQSFDYNDDGYMTPKPMEEQPYNRPESTYDRPIEPEPVAENKPVQYGSMPTTCKKPPIKYTRELSKEQAPVSPSLPDPI